MVAVTASIINRSKKGLPERSSQVAGACMSAAQLGTSIAESPPCSLISCAQASMHGPGAPGRSVCP